MVNSEPKSKVTNEHTQEVFNKVNPLIPSSSYSKLSLGDCFIDEYGTITVCIHGGLNGKGSWSGYLTDLANLVSVLEHEFEDAYIIYIDNDCLDDVFTVHIGIKC